VLLDRGGLLRIRVEDRRTFEQVQIVGHVVDGASIQFEGFATRRESRRLTGAREGRVERLAP